MTDREREYGRAMDVSMAIATAKLFLFEQIWAKLLPDLRSKLNAKDLDMVRRNVREYVSSLPAADFFVPIEAMRSEDMVKSYLKGQFETTGLLDKIKRDLSERIVTGNRTLSDFLK